MEKNKRLLSTFMFVMLSNHWIAPFTRAFSLATSSRRRSSTDYFAPSYFAAPRVLPIPSNTQTPTALAFDNHGAFISRQTSRVALASSPSDRVAAVETEDHESKKASRKRILYLHIWVISMSAFIIKNAKGAQPYPAPLLNALTRAQWALVHAICSMLFSGTIILSALIEYLVVASKKSSVIKFWFLSIPGRLDSKIVLPALTGAIISGVGQAAIDYGGLATSPKHIVGAFHLLSTFGLWWMVTDVTTQRKSIEAVQQFDEEDSSNSGNGDASLGVIPKVLKRRVISNIVSVCFVMAMYALMVLKPGFGK